MIANASGRCLHNRLTPIAAVVLALGAQPASSVETVWLNPGAGIWHDAGQWSTGTVPGPADIAVLANSGTIQLYAPATVDLFLIGAYGSLTGNGTLTAIGVALLGWGGIHGINIQTSGFAWLGSSAISGGGETRVTDLAMLGDGEGFSRQLLDGGSRLTLFGETGFLSAGLNISQGTLTNHGSFESLGDNRGGVVYDNFISGSSGSSVFNNSGAFLQNASGRTTDISAVFNNTGSTIVQSGTLKLSGGGSHTGNFTVDAGQTLEFANGSHTMNAGMITNAGKIKIGFGDTTWAGNLSYTGNGLLETNGGTLNLNLSAPLTLPELRLNGGTVNAMNAISTSFLNMQGGTLNMETGGVFSPDRILLGYGTLNNKGSEIHTPLLEIYGGTLSGSGDVIVNQLNWGNTGGKVSGGGVIRVTGHANLGDGINAWTEMTLDQGKTLELGGLTSLQGRKVLLSGESVISNRGTFTNRGELAGGNVHPNQIAGTGTVNNTGNFTQDASGTSLNISSKFNNSGTVTVKSGTLSLSGGGSHSGDFHIQTGQTLEFSYLGYSPGIQSVMSNGTVHNMGTLRISGSRPVTFEGAAVINGTGGIEVANLTGTLNLNTTQPIVASKFELEVYTGNPSGTVNIGAPLQIQVFTIGGGTVNLNSGGPGSFERLTIQSGTFQANASDITTQALLFRGGTLGGTGTVNVTDLTWAGGTMQGTGVMNVTGNVQILQIPGSDPRIAMYGGRILNLKGVTSLSNFMNIYDSQVNNYGTLASRGSVNGSSVFNGWISGNSASALNNYASFIQDSSGKDTKFDIPFNNSGHVTVKSGNLYLRGGGVQTGQFDIQAGQILELGGGVQAFNPSSSINNAGSLRSSGGINNLIAGMTYTGNGRIESAGNGVLNLDMGGQLHPEQLILGGGTLNANTQIDTPNLNFTFFGTYMGASNPVLAGSADVYTDSLTWSSYGTMSGSGKTIVRGTALLNGGNNTLDQGRILVLNGDTTLQSPGLDIRNSSSVVNNGAFLSRGKVLFDNSVQDNVIAGSGGGLFHNAGGFVQDSAGRTTMVGAAFRNTGQMQIVSGHLVFNGGFQQTMEAGGPGSDAIASGKVSLVVAAGTSVAGTSFVIDDGLVEIDGSLDTWADISGNGGLFTLNGGTLTGTGTINGDVFIGGDATTAVFTPGHSPGMFTINGDLIFAAGSVLELEIGLDGDSNLVWDHLQAHSISFQSGSTVRLRVSAGVGEVQDLGFLSCSSGCGFEEGVSIQVMGRTANVVMDSAGLSVSMAAAVPEPETWAMLLAGLGLVGMRLGQRSWRGGRIPD